MHSFTYLRDVGLTFPGVARRRAVAIAQLQISFLSYTLEPAVHIACTLSEARVNSNNPRSLSLQKPQDHDPART